MADPGLLVWIDMEMTGLDPDVDAILEIASLVTDNDLEVIAEGPELAVHQSEAVLKRMDAWNVEHHTASGLVERGAGLAGQRGRSRGADAGLRAAFRRAARRAVVRHTVWQAGAS